MIINRDYFIFVPAWKLIKSLSIKDGPAGGGVWRDIKEVYIKEGAVGGGSWRKVYNNNVSGPSSNPHPYWRFALDPEFVINDNTSGGTDGLATDLYSAYSNPSGGSYSIGAGSMRVNINSVTTTFVPAVPPTPGEYLYTTETRQIFCNFTANDDSVVTFTNPGVSNTPNQPSSGVNRVGVDGVSVPWTIRAFGYTRSGTTVTGITSTVGDAQTFTISQNTQDFSPSPAIFIEATLSRTYASSYVPPTGGSDAYYTHYGLTRAVSNYDLAVTPGQVYRISVSALSTGTLGTNTRWGMSFYTAPSSGNAFPGGTGAFEYNSPTYGSGTSQTFDVTIPSGHYYMRPSIFLQHSSTTSTNSPPTTPQWARFEWLRVTRVS